jgi:hypothetical protein
MEAALHRTVTALSSNCTELSQHSLRTAQNCHITVFELHRTVTAQSSNCTELTHHSLRTAQNCQSTVFELTPWSRVLPDKLTGLQVVKKFPAFYGTRGFSTAFTRACHLSLSWARSIQSMLPSRPLLSPSEPLVSHKDDDLVSSVMASHPRRQ